MAALTANKQHNPRTFVSSSSINCSSKSTPPHVKPAPISNLDIGQESKIEVIRSQSQEGNGERVPASQPKLSVAVTASSHYHLQQDSPIADSAQDLHRSRELVEPVEEDEEHSIHLRRDLSTVSAEEVFQTSGQTEAARETCTTLTEGELNTSMAPKGRPPPKNQAKKTDTTRKGNVNHGSATETLVAPKALQIVSSVRVMQNNREQRNATMVNPGTKQALSHPSMTATSHISNTLSMTGPIAEQSVKRNPSQSVNTSKSPKLLPKLAKDMTARTPQSFQHVETKDLGELQATGGAMPPCVELEIGAASSVMGSTARARALPVIEPAVHTRYTGLSVSDPMTSKSSAPKPPGKPGILSSTKKNESDQDRPRYGRKTHDAWNSARPVAQGNEFDAPISPSKPKRARPKSNPAATPRSQVAATRSKKSTGGRTSTSAVNADDGDDAEYRIKHTTAPVAVGRATRASRNSEPLVELGSTTRDGPRRQSNRTLKSDLTSNNEGNRISLKVPHDGSKKSDQRGLVARAHSLRKGMGESIEEFEESMTNMHNDAGFEPGATIARHHPGASKSDSRAPKMQDEQGVEEAGESRIDLERQPQHMHTDVSNVEPSVDQGVATACPIGGKHEYEEAHNELPVTPLERQVGQTSATIPSSPPGSRDSIKQPESLPGVPLEQLVIDQSEVAPLTERDLRQAERIDRIHKPNVIRFDQDGPRNRGVHPSTRPGLPRAPYHGSSPGSPESDLPPTIEFSAKNGVGKAIVEVLCSTRHNDRLLGSATFDGDIARRSQLEDVHAFPDKAPSAVMVSTKPQATSSGKKPITSKIRAISQHQSGEVHARHVDDYSGILNDLKSQDVLTEPTHVSGQFAASAPYSTTRPLPSTEEGEQGNATQVKVVEDTDTGKQDKSQAHKGATAHKASNPVRARKRVEPNTISGPGPTNKTSRVVNESSASPDPDRLVSAARPTQHESNEASSNCKIQDVTVDEESPRMDFRNAVAQTERASNISASTGQVDHSTGIQDLRELSFEQVTHQSNESHGSRLLERTSCARGAAAMNNHEDNVGVKTTTRKKKHQSKIAQTATASALAITGAAVIQGPKSANTNHDTTNLVQYETIPVTMIQPAADGQATTVSRTSSAHLHSNRMKRPRDAECAMPSKRAKALSHPTFQTPHKPPFSENEDRPVGRSRRRIIEHGSPLPAHQEQSLPQQQENHGWEDASENETTANHVPHGYLATMRSDKTTYMDSSPYRNATELGNEVLRQEREIPPIQNGEQSQAISHAGFARDSSVESIAQPESPKSSDENPFDDIQHDKDAESEGAWQPTKSFLSRLKSDTARHAEDQVDRAGQQAGNQDVDGWQEHGEYDDPEKTLVNNGSDSEWEEQEEDIEGPQSSQSSERSFESPHKGDFARALNTWTHALRPHQRSVHDSLFRLTHELLRNLVDAETAIKDIVQDYQDDCSMLMDKIEEEHKLKLEQFFTGSETMRRELARGFKATSKHLKKDMAEVETSCEANKKTFRGNEDHASKLDRLLREFGP